VNYEICALLEHWNFCAKNVDKPCDFLDWLAWDTYEFETSCSDFRIPCPCIINYVPPVHEICHCSNHDSISYPYYISDNGFVRLSSMIETMNEQQVEFKMREYDLLHETGLRFSSTRLDVYLCDDGV